MSKKNDSWNPVDNDWFDGCGEYVDEFGDNINEIEARVS